MIIFLVLQVTFEFGALTQHAEEDDPCDMYGEMPNIEITSPETPDAIYRPSPRGWDPESEEIDTYDDSEVVW